jgi:hypothetical protein
VTDAELIEELVQAVSQCESGAGERAGRAAAGAGKI